MIIYTNLDESKRYCVDVSLLQYPPSDIRQIYPASGFHLLVRAGELEETLSLWGSMVFQRVRLGNSSEEFYIRKIIRHWDSFVRPLSNWGMRDLQERYGAKGFTAIYDVRNNV